MVGLIGQRVYRNGDCHQYALEGSQKYHPGKGYQCPIEFRVSYLPNGEKIGGAE